MHPDVYLLLFLGVLFSNDCKSRNISSTLSFLDFALRSASVNFRTRVNICTTSYACFERAELRATRI